MIIALRISCCTKVLIITTPCLSDYDSEGVARYAALHGTWKHMTNSFKGEVAGSNKRYSFCVQAIEKSDKLIVTESAMMRSLLPTMRNKIGDVHYLFVGGAYSPKTHTNKIDLPKALKRYLQDHNEIKVVELVLDNDEIGIGASILIINTLYIGISTLFVYTLWYRITNITK